MKSPLTFFFALALLAGCFTLPPGPGPDLSIPYKTLAYLRDSYLLFDANGVDYTLDDDFIFYFDADDVDRFVNGYRIPFEGWERYLEYIATQNMFADADIMNLYLDLKEMEPLPEGATTYASGWLSYTIKFYPLSQDDFYYCNGETYFELAKTDGEWKITLWRDRKAGEHSWGWLKAMYRYPPPEARS